MSSRVSVVARASGDGPPAGDLVTALLVMADRYADALVSWRALAARDPYPSAVGERARQRVARRRAALRRLVAAAVRAE